MLSVTVLALGRIVFGVFVAMKSAAQSDEDNQKRIAAENMADDAAKSARDAQDKVAKLSNDLIDLGKRVDKATDALLLTSNTPGAGATGLAF